MEYRHVWDYMLYMGYKPLTRSGMHIQVGIKGDVFGGMSSTKLLYFQWSPPWQIIPA